MSFFDYWFKPKQDPLAANNKIQETIDNLEKKLKLCEKKSQLEQQKAKAAVASKNTKAAVLCLKRKKMIDKEIDDIQNQQMRLQDQLITLESAKTVSDTVTALKTGADALKAIGTDPKDVEDLVDNISQHVDNLRAAQEAISQPIGYEDDVDIDRELSLLELDDSVNAATSIPSVNSAVAVATPLAAAKANVPQKAESPVELQAEMAA